MNHRIAQVESTLKRVVAEVLQRSVSDPRIEGMISITKVNVSDDLANATIYVSVLPAEKQRTTVKGLEHAAVHIHGLAKKKLALRRVPRFTFRGDDELKKQAETLGAIRHAMDRSGDADPSPPGGGWEGADTHDQGTYEDAGARDRSGHPHPGPLPGGEGATRHPHPDPLPGGEGVEPTTPDDPSADASADRPETSR